MCYNVWPQTPGMLKSEWKCESQKAVPLGRWLGQCPVTAQNVTTVVPLLVHKVSKAPLYSEIPLGSYHTETLRKSQSAEFYRTHVTLTSQ